MPNVGDIVHGKDLGKSGSYYAGIKKNIYAKCPDCGKERWVILRPSTSSGISRCQSCCGKQTGSLSQGKMENSPHWKGGRGDYTYKPYIYIRISDTDPFYPMSTHQGRCGGGEILEHRLIMARHLNRMLTRKEHVHHKNGDKTDNRLENLELVSPANHSLYDVMCSHCSVRTENRRLKAEIKRLTAQLKPMIRKGYTHKQH